MSSRKTPVNILDYIYLPYSVKDSKSYKMNQQWLLFEISTQGFSNNKYLIYVSQDYNNNIYMKPYKPYMNKEFEDLFNFGMQCINYTDDKVIIVNDKDYYKNFTKYFNTLDKSK